MSDKQDIVKRLFHQTDGYRRGGLEYTSPIAVMIDAEDAIYTLRENVAALTARLEKAEAERDQVVEQQIAAVDDLQTARNDALASAQDHLRRVPSFGDGKWAANHLEALKAP